MIKINKFKAFYLIIKRLLLILLKISKSKISFSKIKKSKVLVFGVPGFINVLNDKKYNFIKFKDINFLHNWGESYNFYILIKCLIKLKFNFLFYSNEYISAVNPKIILSFLDHYKIFYLLKKKKNQKKILIQFAFRANEYGVFKKNKDFLKNKVDYVFAFNKGIAKKYVQLLGCKTYSTGSFLSNDVIKKKYKKIYDIVYISTFRAKSSHGVINKNITIKDYLDTEADFVKKIMRYAEENKRKLHILCTKKYFNKTEEIEEIEFFNDIFKNKKWNMIRRTSASFKFTYNVIDKSNIILGIDSTVLYESFARGQKTIFFDIRPTNKFLEKTRYFAWPNKLNKNGPFWESKNDFNSIQKIIDKVYRYNNKQWLDINNKYKNKIMSYDDQNKKFNLLMKKLIN